MAFKRFLAPTSRQAMEAVRREVGDDAVILSNRRVGDQIEILAAAADTMEAIVEDAVAMPVRAARASAAAAQVAAQVGGAPRRAVATPPAARGLPAAGGAAMYARIAAAPESAPGETEAPEATEAPEVRPWSPPLWRGATVRFGSDATRPRRKNVASTHESMAPLAAHATAAAPRPVPSAPAAPAALAAAAPRPAQRERARAAAAESAPPTLPRSAMPLSPPPSGDDDFATTPAAGIPPAVFRRRPSRLGPPTIDRAHGGEAAAVAATPGADAGAAPPPNTYVPPPGLDFSTHAPGAAAPATPPPAAPLAMDPRVLAELQSMRKIFSQQIAALNTSLVTTLSEASRLSALRGPAAATSPAPGDAGPVVEGGAQVYVMMRLLTSGFSPELARRMAQHAPRVPEREALDGWLQQVLATNLRCADPARDLIDARGALALVGPTGVGKTTTLAKLAARFAVRHGAGQLGLVTLDTYRVGAHEQLRVYGKILGVPVQVAHDGATLNEMLAAMQGRRLVLIDTCGVSQRDERLREMLALLDAARSGERPVRRLLLLNAALHVESLDDVARAWHAPSAAGVVLTKIDEAARLGGALDCALRHRLLVMGLTNGQRVPEDWHAPNAQLLAHIALKPVGAGFDLVPSEAAALVPAAAAAPIHD